jgi:NADP-reducing hydrogenase subunit HndB
MPAIKSLDELKRIREEALKKRDAKATTAQAQIIVGMGTPGIAAGARETMKAILAFIETHHLAGIVVRQTGSLGFDSSEPIVQVQIGDAPLTTYGKVTVARAEQIMERHVVGGQVVTEWVIGPKA